MTNFYDLKYFAKKFFHLCEIEVNIFRVENI